MHVGFVCSRVRKDEKLLLEELRSRGHEVTKIDPRRGSLGLREPSLDDLDVPVDSLDVAANREMSQSRGLYVTRFLESYGVPVVNSHETSRVCMDKIETSLALEEAGVPTPETHVAFTPESALEVCETIGYPVVVKPVVGSWARLLGKLNDREAAEAVFEHKKVLGSYEHDVVYLQEYVDHGGRDVRLMVRDSEVVAGMERQSDDWITNAARGAETTGYQPDERTREAAVSAVEAVGGGVLGVDVMHTDEGPVVHEVNHTLEFKALTEASGVDIAAEYADHLEDRAR
ncbi:MAG: RimK family alpha-L-glutamate ligase [Halobacteriales archaeon]